MEMHQQSRLPYSVNKQNTAFGGMCEFGFGSPSKIGSICVLQDLGLRGHSSSDTPSACFSSKLLCSSQKATILQYNSTQMQNDASETTTSSSILQPALQYFSIAVYRCRRMWFIMLIITIQTMQKNVVCKSIQPQSILKFNPYKTHPQIHPQPNPYKLIHKLQTHPE